jgi:hypothetical protein
MPHPRVVAIFVQCAVLLIGVAPVVASDYLATDDFHDVEKVVEQYVEKFGAEHVLVAVDIDNTLLAMNQDLGSDQWFEWQEYLLNHDPTSPDLVARSFDGLLDAQGLLYTLGRMHAPQIEQPAIIARLQGMGAATLVLTSRGDEFRIATERELVRSGYDFARSALAVRDPRGGTYLPYDLSDPAAAGLSDDEVAAMELSQPRPVSYENGIMMAAGQHKGAILLTILHESARDIRAVVFVDDHGRHVGRVFAALTARELKVAVLHYFREDDHVARFRYSDKRDVTRRWKRLSAALEEAFK